MEMNKKNRSKHVGTRFIASTSSCINLRRGYMEMNKKIGSKHVGTRFIASTSSCINLMNKRIRSKHVGTRFIASRSRFKVRPGGRDKSRPYIPPFICERSSLRPMHHVRGVHMTEIVPYLESIRARFEQPETRAAFQGFARTIQFLFPDLQRNFVLSIAPD